MKKREENMAKVNLDALIPREDFEAIESLNTGRKKETISIEDLKQDSFFFPVVRKPDFQRETNEWDPDKIVLFVESFINGDLIPAIILWRNPSGYIFVIDGSHRLSSLIAWINDDYGDGPLSKSFYDWSIPSEQINAAEDARRLIKKRIGTYDELKQSLSKIDKTPQEILNRAKNLAALAIQLQWVEGDVKTAEQSFLKINQQAAPIDPTEFKLIESRKKPNPIASRAIIRSGKGHKYWSKFSELNQLKIQELSTEVHNILFTPKLELPLKTLDIPIGGKLYASQTLPLVLEFVNITNNIPPEFKDKLHDDDDGIETIKLLTNAKKVAQRINSIHPSSLGLHPIVYFYSQDGRHKIASFFATVSFVINLDSKKMIDNFIKVRALFEHIINENDYLIQQINRKYRLSLTSYPHIREFFFLLIELLNKGHKPEEVIDCVVRTKEFSYLTIQKNTVNITTKEFSREIKSVAYIKEAISNALKCKICGGFIHKNSMTIDHIERKQDGGLGSIDNAQLAHPYCNSTYKN